MGDSISYELEQVISEINPDFSKYMRAAKYRDAFARAVMRTWRESEETARFILQHTNAFYIRKDERPRKGSDKDKPYVVAEICIDDSSVRAEVNFRRELLKLELAFDNVHVEEVRIIAARMGMKQRHPFASSADDAASMQQKRAAFAPEDARAQVDKSYDLQTVKRAFCLVFGVGAKEVLEKINAADLAPVSWEQRDGDDATRVFASRTQKATAANDVLTLRERKRGDLEDAALGSRAPGDRRRASARHYHLRLYTFEPELEHVVAANRDAIISRARDLGLLLSSISVHEAWPEARTLQAFPTTGLPIPFCQGSNER